MLIEKAEKKYENLSVLSLFTPQWEMISNTSIHSVAAYRGIQLQLINTVKHIGGCFTGDPSIYINKEYDRKKKNQKNKNLLQKLVLNFILK